MKKIQITGSEKNKDNAMGSLNNQDTSFHCLPDEVYVVSDTAIKRLEEDKIKFVILDSGTSIVHNLQKKIGDKQRIEIEKLVIAKWLITVNKPTTIEDMIRMIVQLTLNEVEEVEDGNR